MVEVFEKYTLDKFNEHFGTRLTEAMTVEEFTNELENAADISYYYASYNVDDIVETADDEDYDLGDMFVYLIGDVYVATQYSI